MFCIKCGNQLSEEALFCNKCGAKRIVETKSTESNENRLYEDINEAHSNVLIESSELSNEESKQRKKTFIITSVKKKTIITISTILALGIIGAIAIAMFISHINDPVNKLESAVLQGDFDTAAQLYRDEIRYGDSDKRTEAEEFIISHAESIRTAYINSEIEYEDALTQLQQLGRLGIVSEDEFAPMINEINDMRTSRMSYENALQGMETGDYKSAINDFRKVIQADTNYSDAQTQLVNAVRLYKNQIFDEVASLELSTQYDDAISVINAALLVVPNDADFSSKIIDLEKLIADEIALIIEGIVRDARNKVTSSSDYTGAISDLRSAMSTYPSNDTLQNALTDIENEYIAKNIAEANALVAESGDYTTAMANLRTLLRQHSNNAELSNAISSLEDGYVSIKLDEAAVLAGNGEYEEAVVFLRDALNLAPNNVSLLSTISDYEAKYPVRLSELTWFLKGGDRSFKYADKMTDNFGEEHFDFISMAGAWPSSWYDTGWEEYVVNKSYSRITGTVLLTYSDRNNDGGYLVIYGDDRILFTSNTMNKGTNPQKFDVDIRGIEKIRIEFTNGRDYWGIANVMLHY